MAPIRSWGIVTLLVLALAGVIGLAPVLMGQTWPGNCISGATYVDGGGLIFYCNGTGTAVQMAKFSDVGGGGAPADAPYWTSGAVTGLTGEVNLGALATGLVLNTSGTPTAYGGASCTNQFPRSLSGVGAPTCASVNLASDITGTLSGANGGTGNGFFAVSGPTTTLKTFTLPNASTTILTTNTAVTVGQGGTGLTATADDAVLVGDSTSASTARTLPNCADTGGQHLNYATGTNSFSCGTSSSGGGSAALLANASTADQTANAADTYLTGGHLTIGARQKAGTIIRWRMMYTKSAAGVAAPVISVRFGTNGSTSDTARCTLTGVAQTAAADTGWLELEVIVRSVGATATVHCGMAMEHFNTTTGLANKAQGQYLRATSATFDNTSTSTIVGVSINPGASGVWTIQHVSTEALNLT